jgi:group II intron reverse transcriptase/maturase
MPSSVELSTKLARIAKLAKDAPDMAFTSLAHHVDMILLKEAFRRTRKDGACGIDGVTAQKYEENLEVNLQFLLDRAKSGIYRAPPIKRVLIPKLGSTEKRAIGIPTFEDKVLQRAVTMVLEAIYEQDFLPCSYGYRPRKSAHQMLEDLWKQLMSQDGGYVIEIDIRKFFDTMDHTHMRNILGQRVRDGVLSKLIGKWMNAGALSNGAITYPEQGVPQGGTISPMLSNIFLHHVLDKWFEQEVKARLAGDAHLFRFADDAIMLFSHESDAQRVLAVLSKRFAKFGLALHPDKTRLTRFLPTGDCSGGSFSLLGFCHYWGKSRKGNLVVKRKTDKKRLCASIKRIAEWCRKMRHMPVADQHRQLCSKVKGHNSYYGITCNSRAISIFREEVRLLWKNWLSRRSRKAKKTWEWFTAFSNKYPLPKPITIHSVCRRAANI